MRKKVVVIIVILCLFSIMAANFFFLCIYPINLKNVSYEVKDQKITTILTFSDNVSNGTCQIIDKEVPIINHQCTFTISNEPTDIYIKTKWNKKTINLNPEQDQVLDFITSESKIYMIIIYYIRWF